MDKRIFQPHPSAAALILRLGVAAIVLFHGILKLRQQGGADWNSELPEATQMAVAWGEVACGAAMVLGLLTRLAAIGVIVIQVGAIMLMKSGEFIRSELSWRGFNFERIGFEYNFAIIIMCLALVFLGSGEFSVDHLIWPRKKDGAT